MKRSFLSPALLCFLLLFAGSSSKAQDSLRLVFIGDVMQHMPQINSAKQGKGYCYTDCFRYVASKFSDADLAIANLELTTASAPYSGYPCFSAPDEIALTLKDVGFDLLATANNHSCDKGKNGVVRTLDVLDSLKLPHTGTFRSMAEKKQHYPLILNKNGFKLAFLCYTYGTNGNKIPATTEVNLIEKDSIAKDLATAKAQKPDAIIVIMHWGQEYQRAANAEQKQLTDFMLAKGATLIIGSHPHVIQPMELRYQPDTLMGQQYGTSAHNAIVYSLGNFVSNQETRYSDGGAIAYITLAKTANSVKITNAEYSLVWVYKPVINGQKRFYILPVEEFENSKGFFQSGFYERFDRFVKDSRTLLESNKNGFNERKF